MLVRKNALSFCRTTPVKGISLVFGLVLVLVGLALWSVGGRAAPFWAPVPGMNNITLTPAGDLVVNTPALFTIPIRNTGDPANGILTFTLPSQMSFMAATAGYSQSGDVVTWTLTNWASSTYVNYTVTAQVDAGVVLHDVLNYSAQLKFEGANLFPRSGTRNVQNATVLKRSVTDIVAGAPNTADEAVAGELVTTTVYYTIPQGTMAYTVTPKVLLQDGLSPYASDPAWSSVYTDVRNTLRFQEAAANYDGVLVIFPNQGDLDATAITQTVVVTIYSRQLQTRPVANTELTDGTAQTVQAVLRWCGAATCDLSSDANYYVSDVTSAGRVILVRPDMQVTLTPVYLDADGIGAGGGLVRLTLNSTNRSGRPTAYDMVFTTTLGAGLSHNASSGTGAGAGTVSAGPEGVTYVAWNVPGSLAANQSWQAVITATLPSSFTIGLEIPYTATMQYETFAGAVVAEGLYQNIGASALQPGIAFAKTSTPSSGSLTMGDRVTYTVTIKQGAHTTLQSPICTDTLPLGFHYVSGTLSVVGATVASSAVAEGPVSSGEYFEDLGWTLNTLPESASNRWVTATFVALNTGWDFRDKAVHELAADMKVSRPTVVNNYTGVTLRWTPPSGSTYAMLDKINSTNLGVIQPFMAEGFASTRTGTGALEVGQQVILNISFRNNGANPGVAAQEMLVCDTLPEGLTFAQDNGVSPSNLTRTQPEAGSSGTICWTFDAVPRGTLYTLAYIANVTPAVIPGYMTNHAEIPDYTTQSGDVEGERHYREVPAGLPAPVNCGDTCIQVVGLEVTKTPWVSMAEPGDLITYTLAYTDSGSATYTGVVISDTYDTYLIYRDAIPTPDVVDTDNHRLIWDIGSVANTSGQILLTMQVQNPLPDGVVTLTNKIAWNSDQTVAPDRERVVVTPLDVANLIVDLRGPETTYAGGQFVYTATYTNVGPTNRPITLTFDYDPNLTFVSVTGDAAQWAGSDHIFVGTAPSNTPQEILVTVDVAAPLNYAISELESMVTLASEGATSKSDSTIVEVLRPQVELFKISDVETAPDAGGAVVYNFTVQNTGNFTATGCVITDTWDGSKMSWLVLGDWNDTGDDAATWGGNPFVLTPGTTITPGALVLKVDFNSDHYENYLDVTCDQVSGVPTFKHDLWKASIETAKTASDVIAFPGRTLTYTVYYTNTSAGAGVINAVITDHLPSGVVLEGYTQGAMDDCLTGFTYGTQPGASGGTDVYWRCASLNISGNGSLQVWGTVSGDEETVITNTTASDGDGTVPYRPGTVEVPLTISRPRLSLTQTLVVAHPEYSKVAPGDIVVYELAYHNRGTATANDVVFSVQLPTAVVSFSSATGGGAEASGVVTWDIGTVRPGRGGVVYLEVQALYVAPAEVIFDAGDLEISSRRLTVDDSETQYGYPVIVTINNPDLTVKKSVWAPSLQPNDLITYTVVLTNSGGGRLYNVIFTDTLSTYLTVVSAPGCVHSGGVIPAGTLGGVLTCTVGTLTQHAPTYTVQIVARLSNLTQGEVFYNTAWASSDQTVPVPSNAVPVGGDAPYGLLLEPTAQSGLPPYSAPKQVYFNLDAAGSTPIAYVITFGDGASASGTLPSYGAVNTTYQMSGTYTVIMTATNEVGYATSIYPITVTGAPALQVTPLAVTVNLLAGAQTSQPLTITNGAAATDILNWSLSESPDRAWLTPTLTAGTLDPGDSDGVTLEFDATGLTPGSTYTTTLFIAGDGAPVEVDVTLNVLAPVISWTPNSFSKSADVGSTTVLTDILSIQNTGTAELQWSISIVPATTTWLTVSVSGSQTLMLSGQRDVLVSFDPTDLVSNTYTANLHITTNDALHPTVDVPVTFTITSVSTDYDIYLPLVLRNMP